jgi:hypothetical protein
MYTSAQMGINSTAEHPHPHPTPAHPIPSPPPPGGGLIPSPVLEVYKSDILQKVAFYLWLISFSIRFVCWRFAHFYGQSYSIIRMGHRSLIHSPIDRHFSSLLTPEPKQRQPWWSSDGRCEDPCSHASRS